MSDKSSASHEKMSPAPKPSASFVTDSAKSGEYGDRPIQCRSVSGSESTSKSVMSKDFASKSSMDEVSGTMVEPEGKPADSFVNTSAVK